jgi:hypothetical protein
MPSPAHQLTDPTKSQTLHAPAGLLQSTELPQEFRLAYLLLWNIAGARPGRVAVRFSDLAAMLGKSERAGYRWIERLTDAGWIEAIETWPRGGTFRVLPWRPRDSRRPRPSKPGQQKHFTFAELDQTDNTDEPETLPLHPAMIERNPIARRATRDRA